MNARNRLGLYLHRFNLCRQRPVQPQEQAPVVEIPISEENVANLMDLGFPRDQVVEALRVSNNDPDRAAGFLFQ
jgi:uncharacterized UBP type Zn finger protein